MKPASRIAIDDAMRLCENHLRLTNTWGTDIESYLTRFLVIFICGKYERELERMINARAESTKDKGIASFIAELIFHKDWVHLSEIRGEILGRFGEEYKKAFDKRLYGSVAPISYENIVIDRMSSAHGGGLTKNITFKELKNSYKEADKVLTVVSRILKVQRL